MSRNDIEELASKFHDLFAGAENAHGTCEITDDKRIVAKTVRSPADVGLWVDHLAGTANLGICPVGERDLCSWGAIDVDSSGEDVDLVGLARQIERSQLPLIACRSKSGGAHLYLFLSPTSASSTRDQLEYCARRLGQPRAEVFPKQTHLNAARGDVGSWVLMPYFSANYTKRYAIDSTGKRLSAREFLRLANSMKEVAA